MIVCRWIVCRYDLGTECLECLGALLFEFFLVTLPRTVLEQHECHIRPGLIYHYTTALPCYYHHDH